LRFLFHGYLRPVRSLVAEAFVNGMLLKMTTLLLQEHICRVLSLKKTTRRLMNRIFSIIVSILHSLLVVLLRRDSILENEEKDPSPSINQYLVQCLAREK
jgi:hypothetical protein